MHILIPAALRTLLMALIVALGIVLTRTRSTSARRSAWTAVLLASLAMPLVPFANFGVNIPIPASLASRLHLATPQPIPASLRQMNSQNVPAEVYYFPDEDDKHPQTTQTQPASQPTADPSSSRKTTLLPRHTSSSTVNSGTSNFWTSNLGAAYFWTIIPWAILGYASIALALLLRLAAGLIQTRRLWTNAIPTPELGANIRLSDRTSIPATIGTGILLPAAALNWPQEKLHIVLAHERAHVRQRDFHIQLLASLNTAIFWFSPLSWWLRRHLADLGEALSDHAAASIAPNRAYYAELLLEFAHLRITPTTGAIAMPLLTSNLRPRIERLLNDTRFESAFAHTRRTAILTAAITGLAITASLSNFRSLPQAHAAVLSSQDAISVPNPAPEPKPAPQQPAPTPQPVALAEASTTGPISVLDSTVPQQKTTSTQVAVPASADAPAEVEVTSDQLDQSAPSAKTSRTHSSITNFVWTENGHTLVLHTDKENGPIHVERDGKSYLITDPKLTAEICALISVGHAVTNVHIDSAKIRADLDKAQAELAKSNEQIKIQLKQFNNAELKKQLSDLKTQLNSINDINALNNDQLSKLMEQTGQLQSQLALAQIPKAITVNIPKIDIEKLKLVEFKDLDLSRLSVGVNRKTEEKIQTILNDSIQNGKAQPQQ